MQVSISSASGEALRRQTLGSATTDHCRARFGELLWIVHHTETYWQLGGWCFVETPSLKELCSLANLPRKLPSLPVRATGFCRFLTVAIVGKQLIGG